MKDLIDHIKANCTPIDREARFDQMLDEVYDFKSVGGPFTYMVPSQVLKEMDPTAYRCGVNDYMDGEDTYEIDCDTYDKEEVEDARGNYIGALEDELADLQYELDQVEVEDSGDRSLTEYEDERDRLQDQINTVEERINEAKSYQF